MVIAASFRVRGIWRCRDWVAAGRSQAGWGNFQPVVVVRLLSVTGRMSAPREPKRLDPPRGGVHDDGRSEEHTSELKSLMRISYAVLCLKKKNKSQTSKHISCLCTLQTN